MIKQSSRFYIIYNFFFFWQIQEQVQAVKIMCISIFNLPSSRKPLHSFCYNFARILLELRTFLSSNKMRSLVLND